jgi:hypothetical protein
MDEDGLEATFVTRAQSSTRRTNSKRGGFAVLFRKVLPVAAVALVAMPLASAQAWWRVGIGIGVPIYRPYPYGVYVAPAPVYVVPAPVVVQPAPIVVQPAPIVSQPTTIVVPATPLPPSSATNLPPQPIPIR